MSVDLEVVRENLARARAAIAEAARVSGREASAVELLAAVKYVEPEDMETLAAAGIELVGENRVEQLLAKQEVAREHFAWDFIGHLQSRKARDLVGRVRLVHSLSTLSAAERLDRSSAAPIACLVEVNVAGEDSKQGLAPSELDGFLEAVAQLPNIRVEGLMTMPPLADAPEVSRPYFAALRELAQRLDERWAPQHAFGRLSMGTSQDYVVAAEEGGTIVRLGSTLYRRSSV
jgi:pyridoxal phosphate enzyme (YggS family)